MLSNIKIHFPLTALLLLSLMTPDSECFAQGLSDNRTELILQCRMEPDPKAYENHFNIMVHRCWSNPRTQSARTALLKWKVQRSGEVTDIAIDRSSGDKAYDQSLVDALELASPFFAVPTVFKSPLSLQMDWSSMGEDDYKKLQGGYGRVEADPVLYNRAITTYKKAKVAIKESKYDDAIEELEKVLAIDSSTLNDPLLVRLSIAYCKRGAVKLGSDRESAIKDFRKALSIRKENTEAWQQLNKALRAEDLNPYDFSDRLKMAKDLESAGQKEEALLEYEAALKLRSTPEILIKIGELNKAKKFLEQEQKWKSYLSKNPKNLSGLLGLAYVLEKQEKNKEALGIYRRILEINPTDQNAVSAEKRLTKSIQAELPLE